MRTPTKFWLLLLMGVALLGAKVFGADFSPILDEQLARAQGNEMIPAIVILESPIDIQALDNRLHESKAGRADRHKQVLDALHYNADFTQPKFRTELDLGIDAGTVKQYEAFWIENLFVVWATRDVIDSYRSRGDIEYVSDLPYTDLIRPIPPLTPGGKAREWRNSLDNLTLPVGLKAINADRVANELGITGQGVLVGNCDTGVDGTHPALQTRWRGYGGAHPWQECWYDALNSSTTPADAGQHGTHTMGTITGRAISGADTTWTGVAPDARWIASRAIDTGRPLDSLLVDAFRTYQWFADPDGNSSTTDDQPDVVSNSWGVTSSHVGTSCYDYWNTVLTNLEAAGTVVVFAAGNEGPTVSSLRSPSTYSLNATQIFSVGAVDASAYPTTPYPAADFSSRGPTTCAPAIPDNIKPEIAAPGVNVYSTVPGGGYEGTWSGTSMATPHVAGVVALMRQACPDCDPTTIKTAMMSTAIDYGTTGHDNTFGAGFIDAYAAVLSVSNLGRVAGFVRDASSNPIAGALVKNASGAQQILTDALGYYILPLQAGTYTLEFSKFGYIAQNIPGVVIVLGDTTDQNATLQLAPQGIVHGLVTNCFGAPANGATVTITNAPVSPATTDINGLYSINLPQGTYDMRASGAGCGAQTITGVIVGANTVQNFTLPTDPRYDCSAADAAGYIACEDGDLGGPSYLWYEVSPASGGLGTIATGVTGDDAGESIALPFTFRSYGVDYTSVWVCTNGFLAFGSTPTAYGNLALPDATLGNAVVPLWDDLSVTATSDVSYYYYSAENAFIVEWRAVPPLAGGAPHTFQVWLYNVATNPGPTGNSQIKIQYQTIGANALSSATVGVQNSTIANQYMFNGALDPNAQGLVNSRVICYGGCTVPQTGTITGLITNCTGGPAANATVSFPGSFYPSITANASGVYTQQVVAGTYNVGAANATCSYAQSDNHPVLVNQTVTVNISLLAPGIIQGTITSCTGGPATGATVSLVGTSVTPQTTSGSGFYAFNSLPAGTYTCAVNYSGCYPDTAGGLVVTSGGTTIHDVTLISDPSLSCSPADAYDYTACEDVDPSGPVFTWRAVAPAEGGAGTLVTGLLDDNFAGPFTFPFTVKFFGTDYTSYYVSSNGYMTLGGGYAGIPYTCMPMVDFPAGLYVFGDDLYPPTGGEVATYYDAANHLFVLEYYQIVHFGSGGGAETFEIVIYDPTYYPTATSDANIDFQYNTVANVTNNTVGIQTATGSPYFHEYWCNDDGPVSSFGIAAGRAVRFSTGPGCEGTPVFAVTPSSVSAIAPLGGTTTDSIQICNQGICPLNWSLAWNQISPAIVTVAVEASASANLDKDEAMRSLTKAGKDKTSVVEGRSGSNQLDSQGGPDTFGYLWRDSNESGGPVFDWVEINVIGTNAGLNVDEGYVTLALPWQFTYYGTPFSSVNVISNGNIQFGAVVNTAYTNTTIPNSSAPLNMVAPFWEDLNSSTSGNVWYYDDAANNRFIIEYDHVGYYNAAGTATFEVMLYTDGHIVFQYLDMNGITTSATVGQQNASGTDGLQVVYNAAYVVNNLAIQFQTVPPVPQWLSFGSPTSGRVQPGQCSYVRLNFNSADLSMGTYTGTMTITNNDPSNNPAVVPVTFYVGQLDPPAGLTIHFTAGATPTLDFRWTASTAPYYKLYSSTDQAGPYTTLEGTTAANYISIPWTATTRKFFVVVAANSSTMESEPTSPLEFGNK